MATYGYFPGCSLEGTSREYGASTHAVCEALGIELRELKDWNCCGATSAHSTNRDVADALAARNLLLAAEQGHEELVVPCAACYNRAKRVSLALEEDDDRRQRVEERLGRPIPHRVAVRHLIELLLLESTQAALSERRKRDLAGVKVAAYYGCLLLRPQEETGFDDAEQPTTLDDLLRLTGAEPVDWYMKNECCGASLAIPQPKTVERLVQRVVSNARASGVGCIVTACPLCQVNLSTRQDPALPAMPIYYITQVLGWALGLTQGALEMRDVSGLAVPVGGGVA
jgi:heterodisulfide reductase subunit B2